MEIEAKSVILIGIIGEVFLLKRVGSVCYY